MSGPRRRQQLLDVGRAVFAERGFEATSIEEVALRAAVSKPVVYEHFGGKDVLYAVVVEREMAELLDGITSALLIPQRPRELLEAAVNALLCYIETNSDGFHILVRDSPVAGASGSFSGLLNDIASQVEHLLGREFAARGFDLSLARLYSQALVGMVALTGQWWLGAGEPARDVVAAHLVNLAWNGLSGLEHAPRMRGSPAEGRSAGAEPAGRAP